MSTTRRCAALIAGAALASGCGIPFKYQVYQLPPGHTDVLWIYKDGGLHRCIAESGHPVCERAIERDSRYGIGMPEAPPIAAPPPAVKPKAPPARTPEDPVTPQYPDYTTKPG